jgi:choline kinase
MMNKTATPSSTKHAVILVAGEGKRLRPFTLTNPKCFAQVGGRRILENALEALATSGCREVIIVTGHHAELIRTTISDNFAGMSIRYIINSKFETTNSMYSLAMGLDGLDEPTWVLEGDVFFEHTILNLPTESEIGWYVDSAARHLDGAFIEADTKKIARSLKIIRDLGQLQDNQYKSIGILKLSREGVCQIKKWLCQGIEDGRVNDYYDLILGDHMETGMLKIVDVAGKKWFEIDTSEDLENARHLFL